MTFLFFHRLQPATGRLAVGQGRLCGEKAVHFLLAVGFLLGVGAQRRPIQPLPEFRQVGHRKAAVPQGFFKIRHFVAQLGRHKMTAQKPLGGAAFLWGGVLQPDHTVGIAGQAFLAQLRQLPLPTGCGNKIIPQGWFFHDSSSLRTWPSQ